MSTRRPDAYLLRYGEMALRKKNRKIFVEDLVRVLKPRIVPLGGTVTKLHKKLLVKVDAEPEQVRQVMSRVYGVTGISPIWQTDHQLENIFKLAWELMREHKSSGKTFAIKGRRALKRFPMNSMELQKAIADHLLQQGLDLKVDLSHPDVSLGFSVELDTTWLFTETWPGLGGLPTSGLNRFMLLLSGGIDSPVAGNLIQKRGASVDAVYFHTPPFTQEGAKHKVVDLAQVLSEYQTKLRLFVVNFSEIMKAIRARCEDPYAVVLGRRAMMRITVALMQQHGQKAIVTGECLGQVASQTVENITAVEENAPYPILRPLISYDKQEIIRHAKRIGSYEISIQPFEDCCSLFAPDNPVTKARLDRVHRNEQTIASLLPDLEANAIEAVEIMDI